MSLTDKRLGAYPRAMGIDYRKLLGERLTALRKQKPEAVADLNEADRKQLQRMEKGGVSAGLDKMAWAADLFGVEVTDLLRTDSPAAQAGGSLDAQTQELLADFQALPEGWQYYIARKACELREIADRLPPFIKSSMRAIPEASGYWQWEADLDHYIREQKGVVEAQGYVGKDRRETDDGPPNSEPERRGSGFATFEGYRLQQTPAHYKAGRKDGKK